MVQAASNCYVLVLSDNAQKQAKSILGKAGIKCSFVRVKGEKSSPRIYLFTPVGTYEGVAGIRAYTVFLAEASTHQG